MDEPSFAQYVHTLAEAVALSLGGIDRLQTSSILVVWTWHKEAIYGQVNLLPDELLKGIAELNLHPESAELIGYAPLTEDLRERHRFLVATTIAAELFHLSSPTRRQVTRSSIPTPQPIPAFVTADPSAPTRMVRAIPAHEPVEPIVRAPSIQRGAAITRFVNATTPEEKREAGINLVKTLTSLVALAIGTAYLVSWLLAKY